MYRHFRETCHIHHHSISSHIYQTTRCHIQKAIAEKFLKFHLPMFRLRRWKGGGGVGVSHKMISKYLYFGVIYYQL